MTHSQRNSLSMEEAWQYVLLIEKQLVTAVKANPPPTFDEIEELIRQMRSSCESIVCFDFAFAVKNHCENHLWNCHLEINKRYRKLVEVYKKGADQKKHVERRKVEKRYADFLKTSQFFYKSLVQRLASQYPGNFGLRRVAKCLGLEVLSAEKEQNLGSILTSKLELSCYHTLLRLGDLSRYRNQLRTKDRSWDTALGYYQLAQHLLPELGNAHNQLAVISIAEEDHLSAVYQIYRAFTAIEPVKDNVNNLEVEFNKIVAERNKQSGAVKTDSLTALVNWFTLLHAKYFRGSDFSGQRELENEVLTRLTTLLRDPTCVIDEVLNKFVMINIAAEYFASKRALVNVGDDRLKFLKAYSFCLNFNIRFFNALCKVLLPELDDVESGDQIPSSAPTKVIEKITVICRRTLPALRLCSIWLAANAKQLTSYILAGESSPVILAHSHVLEMWVGHAAVLSKLVTYFRSCDDITVSPYMLEEDENTVGFAPFRSAGIPAELRMHFIDDGTLKPRVTDDGIKRNHPNQEMYSRIHSIIFVGYTLQSSGTYPVSFKQELDKFVYDEQSLKDMASASPSFSKSSGRMTKSSPVHSEPSEYSRNRARHNNNDVEDTSKSSTSYAPNNFDEQMSAMVQSLVGAKFVARGQQNQHRKQPSNGNDTSYGMSSTMAQEVFGPVGSNAPRQYTPKHFPRIPGIDGTFAPLPNELSPSTAARQHNRPFSPYSTPEGRLAAAKELGRITGYTQRSSWNQQASQMPIGQPSFGSNYMEYEVNSATNSHSNGFGLRTPGLADAQPSAFDPSSFGITPLRNESTIYPGATNFDAEMMLRSSPWANGRPGFGTSYSQTPPGGQARNGD